MPGAEFVRLFLFQKWITSSLNSLSFPRGARRVFTQLSENYFFEPALLTKVDHLVPRPLLALVGGLRPSFA